MGPPWRRVGRVAFHTGALVSLVLATVAVAMWLRGRQLADRWQWVSTSLQNGDYVRRTWALELPGGGMMRLAGVWVVRRPDPGDPFPVTRFDNGVSHEINIPGVRRAQALSLTPMIGFADPAKLSKQSRYFFIAGTSSMALGEWSMPQHAGREWGLVVPLWAVVAAFSVWPACWELLYRRGLYRKARERWRRERNLCPACGYDLRASAGRCPECGLEGVAAGA